MLPHGRRGVAERGAPDALSDQHAKADPAHNQLDVGTHVVTAASDRPTLKPKPAPRGRSGDKGKRSPANGRAAACSSNSSSDPSVRRRELFAIRSRSMSSRRGGSLSTVMHHDRMTGGAK